MNAPPVSQRLTLRTPRACASIGRTAPAASAYAVSVTAAMSTKRTPSAIGCALPPDET